MKPKDVHDGGWRGLAALCASLVLACNLPRGTASIPAARTAPATNVVAVVAPAPIAPSDIVRLVAARDDLYVIEPSLVRRYILHALPRALQFTQVMRWKEGADKVVMGRPLDLFLDGEALYILDSLGCLWRYDGPAYARSFVPLRLQSTQGKPVALALWQGDLLLLDPDKKEVWRYAPSNGGYNTVPHPLLAHSSSLLSGATRLAPSAAGLLVSRSDGSLVLVPWSRPDAPRLLPVRGVLGFWTSPGSSEAYVATAASVKKIDAARGAVQSSTAIDGLDGETPRDLARSPSGAFYVLTATRILRLTVRSL